MRRFFVLCALFGSAVGCRDVLGIDDLPGTMGSSNTATGGSYPESGKGAEPEAGHAGSGHRASAGEGGKSGSSSSRGGAGASGDGHGGISGSSSGHGGDVASSGRGGASGSDGPRAGRDAPSGGGAGGQSIMSGGDGGGGAGGTGGQPMMTAVGGAGAPAMPSGGAGGTAPPPDPCAMKACKAPRSTCNDNTYVTFEAKQSCPDGCEYEMHSTSCPFGCTSDGCKSPPPDPCAMKSCKPPASTCNDKTFVTFQAKDTCPNGCDYEMHSMNCPFGCTSDGCKSDPCASVVCNSPPKAMCANATTVQSFAAAGMCQNAECSYPSSTMACPSQTPKCNQGACVVCTTDEDCSTGTRCSTTNTCIRAQFVLVDETYTATAMNVDKTELAFEMQPRSGIPADWTKPIPFVDGKAYVELEILEKPSTVQNLYNVCLANSTGYACIDYVKFTAPGKYSHNQIPNTFWDLDRAMDWTKGVTKVEIYVKNDKEEKRPGTDTSFFPMKAHLTVSMVAPGFAYVPPSN